MGKMATAAEQGAVGVATKKRNTMKGKLAESFNDS